MTAVGFKLIDAEFVIWPLGWATRDAHEIYPLKGATRDAHEIYALKGATMLFGEGVRLRFRSLGCWSVPDGTCALEKVKSWYCWAQSDEGGA